MQLTRAQEIGRRKLTDTLSDEVGRMSIALPSVAHINTRVIAGADRTRLQLDPGVGLGARSGQAVKAGAGRQRIGASAGGARVEHGRRRRTSCRSRWRRRIRARLLSFCALRSSPRGCVIHFDGGSGYGRSSAARQLQRRLLQHTSISYKNSHNYLNNLLPLPFHRTHAAVFITLHYKQINLKWLSR